MSYRLFLDDYRKPKDCALYMHVRIGSLNPIYLKKWVIARSYADFVSIIQEKGMPYLISFDHDLADEHYDASMHIKAEYDKLYKTFKEKTGYDAAKWLVDYHIDNGGEFPDCFFHTLNPSGYENIKNYIDNYKKVC